jgi:hypothetical protein
MNPLGSDLIAGSKTADDWRLTRGLLTAGATAHDWTVALDEFFVARLTLRYLKPIHILQEQGTLQGEGFSIAAIQCSLVEFLESTYQGLSYRYLRSGQSLAPHEYSSSAAMFRSFLTEREPFRAHFTSDVADDFYASVRCALFHEARTKNGWRIWAQDPNGRPIDPSTKILFRDGFQACLEQYIRAYRKEVLTDLARQVAFVRKFDSLAG